jgi:predicted acylesterase/phospholipase RssA
VALAALAFILQACTSASRVAITAFDQDQVSGIPDARFWVDEITPSTPRIPARPLTILALSGGGAEGAYGAGFLKGWSQTGRRPRFDIVTGTSVGALMAPFAFLGSEYDAALDAVFAGGIAENLLQVDGLNGLTGAGVYKTDPLKDLIARYANAELLDAIAQEYHKGRLLLVETTNLDTQRSSIWNMGAIAASNAPGRLLLFRSILLASTSIPGLFAPTFIDIEVNGAHFSEMHVDGGVASNVLAVPPGLLRTNERALFGSQIFIIVNGKISPDAAVIGSSTLSIVARSFWTVVKANTRSAVISAYEFCRRNRWKFYVTSIDVDHAIETEKINFDAAYMRELFDYGFNKGRSGQGFQTTPEQTKG